MLAKLALDSEDKIYLSELHNNEFNNLKKNFIGDDRILIEKKNAYSSLSKIISSFKGNKLVLIDPSYELKDEYYKVANLIKHINFQFPKVNLIIWYPVLEDKKIDLFEDQITKLEIKNFLHIKIELDNSFTRMKGTGFFLTNFPFNYLEEIKKSLYEILNVLKEDNKKNGITFKIKKK